MQNKTASPARKSNLLKGVKLAISSNAKQFHGFAQQVSLKYLNQVGALLLLVLYVRVSIYGWAITISTFECASFPALVYSGRDLI